MRRENRKKKFPISMLSSSFFLLIKGRAAACDSTLICALCKKKKETSAGVFDGCLQCCWKKAERISEEAESGPGASVCQTYPPGGRGKRFARARPALRTPLL